MPSLGFGEIVLILLLALIIFGPRRLPEMGRTIGKSMREFRRAASDLRQELEIDEVRNEMASVRGDLEADLEEEPRASVEDRAARLAEQQASQAGEPPRGEAPPT
jgi:sec-independent protein translocase protein TatA